MAEAKTQPTKETLAQYLARVPDPERRKDCEILAALMQKATGRPPVLWGPGIVGFGKYKYTYASGREGEWPVAAFASRKTDLTLYFTPGFEKSTDLMKKLGKFKVSKACVYIRRLSDVDLPTLSALIERDVEAMKKDRVE